MVNSAHLFVGWHRFGGYAPHLNYIALIARLGSVGNPGASIRYARDSGGRLSYFAHDLACNIGYAYRLRNVRFGIQSGVCPIHQR